MLTGPVLTGPLSLARGENAQVQVHKDLNGGVKLVLKDGNHPTGYTVGLNPHSTIMLAGAMLEALGVPVKEMFDGYLKQALQQRGKP